VTGHVLPKCWRSSKELGIASSLNDTDRSNGLLLDVGPDGSQGGIHVGALLNELTTIGLDIHREPFGRPDLRPSKGGAGDVELWIKIGIGFVSGSLVTKVAEGFLQELGKDLYSKLKRGIAALSRHLASQGHSATIEITIRRGRHQWVIVTIPNGEVS
jgi:hypothetical protein